eukprot:gene13727-15130_t
MLPFLWTAILVISCYSKCLAERTILWTIPNQQGIADRLAVISSFLQLGYLLKANVSIPRPCKTLSRGHTKNNFDCSLGWGHYVIPSPFIEFDSFADVKSLDSPSLKYPCEDLVNVTSAFLNHMRELPPAN